MRAYTRTSIKKSSVYSLMSLKTYSIIWFRSPNLGFILINDIVFSVNAITRKILKTVRQILKSKSNFSLGSFSRSLRYTPGSIEEVSLHLIQAYQQRIGNIKKSKYLSRLEKYNRYPLSTHCSSSSTKNTNEATTLVQLQALIPLQSVMMNIYRMNGMQLKQTKNTSWKKKNHHVCTHW